MAEKIIYYAITDNRRTTAEHPAGLARRIEHEGGIREQALHRDMEWHQTGTIVEWRRAESTEVLVEVGETEAERIIEELRERWSKLP